eukprot:185809-Amphidinium_carterae.1
MFQSYDALAVCAHEGRRFVKILQDDPAYSAIVVADLRLPTQALEASMGGSKVTFVTHRLGEDPASFIRADKRVHHQTPSLKEPTESLVAILDGCDCVFSAVTAPLQQATAEQFQRTNVDGIKALVEGNELGRLGICERVSLSRAWWHLMSTSQQHLGNESQAGVVPGCAPVYEDARSPSP